MKTLDQVKAGTPISSAPMTISQPGNYFLTKNLTVSSGDAVTINADNVTLDLNGFAITSTTPSAAGTGILIANSRNLTISNGSISGSVTNSGDTFSGAGFKDGIALYGVSYNVLVSRVSVSGVLNTGIQLGLGESTVVDTCQVHTAGGLGIVAGIVRNSVGSDCGGNGIVGQMVSDSHGISNANGIVAVYTASNCIGSGHSGTGISAATAANCYAASDNGIALSATTASNCKAYSSGSGDAINADRVSNCGGYSVSGRGILANNVSTSEGITNSGSEGLFAMDTAENSSGTSTSGASAIGLHASMAIGCRGYAYEGTGLAAFIANSSFGQSFSGTGQSVAHAYNMPP